MAITRFAISTPSANTNTKIYTADRQAIVSVIATNKASTAATIRIWVQPYLSSTESEYVYHSYDVLVPANNSIETFRFAIEVGDEIYVRSSNSSMSFSINGIYEEKGRQYTTVSSTEPSSSTIGDIWVDSDIDVISYWNGSAWVSSASSTGLTNISTSTTVITSTAPTVIESIDSATNKTAEFIVELTQGSNIRSSKILMITDGSSVEHTEYSILDFGTVIPVTMTSVMNGTTAELKATISTLSSNVVARVHKVVIG